MKSKNFDLSLEYYYAKSSYLSAGLFKKNITNYIGTSQVSGTPFNLHTPANGLLFNQAVSQGCVSTDLTCIRNYILRNFAGQQGVVRGPDDSNGNATGTIAGQPGDPVANFLITVPTNQRSNSLNGVELNWQHVFDNTGFGVAANYTYVHSGLKYDNASFATQYALPGLSNSANLVGFYEDPTWSVRAAYNWRGEFLTAMYDGNWAGRSAPIYTEAYGQWDLTMGYNFSDKLSFQAEVINLNDGIQRLHGRTKQEVIGVTQTGRRFMFGMRYKF